MSTVLQLPQSPSVDLQHAQVAADVLCSLPELEMAAHHLSRVYIAGECFRACACGHWQIRAGQCQLEWVVEHRSYLPADEWQREIVQTVMAGERVRDEALRVHGQSA
jgi:hypothetical protein